MWIPINTLYNNEMKVSAAIREMGEETFLPMRYDAPDLTPREERPNYPLVPAIHNLLFVNHDYSKEWCDSLRNTIQQPIYFIRSIDSPDGYATVRDSEMDQFIRVCDPMICGTCLKTVDEISLKAGQMVRVVKGPLEGLTGKFVRYQKRHYIAIEVSGLCALASVTFKDVERI